MSACAHVPKYPDLSSIPSEQEAVSRCVVVEGDERVAKHRALTAADGQSTKIDAAYWRGLSDDSQKAAVVAHERAHPCIGMEVDCEGCADKVAGYFMRAWGYAPGVVRSAFSTLNVRRDREHGEIVANAVEGARQAERALAGRGLLGQTSAKVSTSLLASRTPARTPTVTAVKAPEPVKAVGTVATRPVAPVSIAPATSPIRPAPVSGVDPGGPGTSTLTPAPEGTEAVPGPPTTPLKPCSRGTNPDGTCISDGQQEADALKKDIAGDVVSAVLGEGARPHASKVLIGAGVAAMLAVALVFIVRRSK